MRIAYRDLRSLSDDALSVRLAGMRDAGDWEAVRRIALEQERRRIDRKLRDHRSARFDPDPGSVSALDDLPIKVHGIPLEDAERRELAAWVRMLAPEGVRAADESELTVRRIEHGD